MIQYVRDTANDPLVISHVRNICEAHAVENDGGVSMGQNPTRATAEAIDVWCRKHFAYVNDPPDVEVLQTPRRMVKQTMVPPQVIRYVIEPLLVAASTVAPPGFVESYEPPALTWGDCDEASVLFVGLCACAPAAVGVNLRPLRFQFGGNDGTLHHVWPLVDGAADGRPIASDITEPYYKIGDYSKFEHYEEVEIPIP
jgi:hypothetical protein